MSVYDIPYDKMPDHSRVVVYGAGKVGEIVVRKILDNRRLSIVGVLDSNPTDKMLGIGVNVEKPEKIQSMKFDCVILAVEKAEIATEMREYLSVLLTDAQFDYQIIWNGNKRQDDSQEVVIEYTKFLERNIESKQPRFFLFMVPEHGNAGDYAITEAEKKFINDYFPGTKIITVSTNEWIYARNRIIDLVNKEDVVFLNGGGYIGDLWEGDTDNYRSIVESLPDNMKVLFSNTLTYRNDFEDNQSLYSDMEWFNKQQRLIAFFRDQRSYQIFRKYNSNCRLFPDMVFYLKGLKNDTQRKTNKLLLCLRDDREKNYGIKENIMMGLSETDFDVEEWDINFQRFIAQNNGSNLVEYVCKKFQGYDAVVTDRLHGMILSVISNVPCIAFDSKTHKVKGVYEWIKDKGYATLADETDIENISTIIRETIANKQKAGNYVVPENEFKKMADIIKRKIEAVEK